MTAQQLATTFERNGVVITNVDGTTRLMTRTEIAKARRFLSRTGPRMQWQTAQAIRLLQASRNMSAMLQVATASGLAF
jgi:hypothetical protein